VRTERRRKRTLRTIMEIIKRISGDDNYSGIKRYLLKKNIFFVDHC